MTTYHVNEAGEPGRCKAEHACPFKLPLDQHYATPKEARASYEESMENKTFNTKSSSPNNYTPITKEWLKSTDVDTQHMVMGALCKVFSRPEFSQNGQNYRDLFRGLNWQAVYDSTSFGKLSLEQGSSYTYNEETHTRPEYERREKAAKRFKENIKKRNVKIIIPSDPGDVFDNEFTTTEPRNFESQRGLAGMKTKLALLSASWLTKLTPEEAESVRWMTSDGTYIVHNHLNGTLKKSDYETYPQNHIEQQYKMFHKAMEKSPTLDEPVILYRGTTMDTIKSFENSDITVDRPLSSTVSGATAVEFGDGYGEDVMLEFKTRKVASVAGMSAWGASELEVLAPLGEYRKVGEFTAMRKTRNNERSRDFTKYDEFKIIQLEFVG